MGKEETKSLQEQEQKREPEQESEQELQEASEKAKKKTNRSEKSVKQYQNFVLRVILLILVIWILFFKIVGLTHMPSEDMYPRVDAGDLVLFYRLDTDVKAQDIIVMEKQTPDSGGEEELFISRVIAAAGDTVEIDGSRLLVNGNAMIESNIFYPTQAYDEYIKYPLTLGSDECFVLGDCREGASDSRYFGPVKKSEIRGTVISILRRNNL